MAYWSSPYHFLISGPIYGKGLTEEQSEFVGDMLLRDSEKSSEERTHH